MAGVEGKGKGKKQRAKRVSVREGDLLPSSQFSRGCFDPFPPFLRPATQAMNEVENVIEKRGFRRWQPTVQ